MPTRKVKGLAYNTKYSHLRKILAALEHHKFTQYSVSWPRKVCMPPFYGPQCRTFDSLNSKNVKLESNLNCVSLSILKHTNEPSEVTWFEGNLTKRDVAIIHVLV